MTSSRRLGPRPVTTWIEALPDGAWQRLSAGDGTKGARLYDWARVPHDGGAPGFGCALLVRRSVADPSEMTFSLTHAPAGASLAELARVAGARWAIESLFERAKGEMGLDQYEVRSWAGWHRYITPAMFVLAHLAVVREVAVGRCGLGGPNGRPAARHGARGQASAGRPRRTTPTQARGHPALVALAPLPPATHTTRPLASADAGAPK